MVGIGPQTGSCLWCWRLLRPGGSQGCHCSASDGAGCGSGGRGGDRWCGVGGSGPVERRTRFTGGRRDRGDAGVHGRRPCPAVAGCSTAPGRTARAAADACGSARRRSTVVAPGGRCLWSVVCGRARNQRRRCRGGSVHCGRGGWLGCRWSGRGSVRDRARWAAPHHGGAGGGCGGLRGGGRGGWARHRGWNRDGVAGGVAGARWCRGRGPVGAERAARGDRRIAVACHSGQLRRRGHLAGLCLDRAGRVRLGFAGAPALGSRCSTWPG